jgi:hypothetical protein
MEAVGPVELDRAICANDVLPGRPGGKQQRLGVAGCGALRVDDRIEGVAAGCDRLRDVRRRPVVLEREAGAAASTSSAMMTAERTIV